MSGREVLSAIKSDRTLRRIPVVVLSGSKAEDDIRASYDLSANCYVIKPIDAEDFMRVVRTVESFWHEVAELPPQDPG
jgi:CheY-like chemotaxis protein